MMLSDVLFRIKHCVFVLLGLCGSISFALLQYFAFAKRQMTMVTNKICIADFIALLGNGSFVNILLIPLCVFIILTLSEHNCSNFNYYLRNKSRTNIILKRFAKIFIFTAVTGVLILLVSVIISGIFAPEFINWNKVNSYSYLSLKVLIDINFVEVLLCYFSKLFFSISFFSCLACTLSLVCKKTISFLIIIFISALNVFSYIRLLIDNIFNFNFGIEYYFNFSSIILTFIIFPIMTLATTLLAVKLAKRKDFLN